MESNMTTTSGLLLDNSTTSASRDHYFLDPVIHSNVRITVVSVVSIAIIVSNTFNVLILRKTHMPINARMYLVNLGLADITVGYFTCVPCIVVSVLGFWPYGEIWCQFAGVITGSSLSVSIWNLAFVGLDRYLAIAMPLKHVTLVSKSRCRIAITSLWLVMITIYMIPIFLVPDFLYYKFNTIEGMCGLYWGFPLFCVLTGIIPVSSSVIVTVTTFSVLRRLKTVDSNLGNQKSNLRTHRDHKAMKILITTTSLFYLCWGPYVISVITNSLFPAIIVPPVLQFIFMWVANSNSFINVLVYSSIYESFRKELKRMVTPRFCRNHVDELQCQRNTSSYVIGQQALH